MKDYSAAIEKKISELTSIVDELPCVVVLHNIQQQFKVEFMSQRGIELLGITKEELLSMGEDYYKNFFNEVESAEHNKRIYEMLHQGDSDQVLSFFQQVKVKTSDKWTWFMTTCKIFMLDDEGAPLLIITNAFPIDPEHQITTKVSRLLEENIFLKQKNQSFSSLSKREKEVLKMMAFGMGSQEMAEKLFISVNTIKTHRKKVIQKLEIKNSFDLNEYARAFDLI